MNWEAFGAIAEAIGAMAVVVTLAYLAVQIRQNTAAQETTSVWLMTQIFNQTHTSISENIELAGALDKAWKGEAASPAEERMVFSVVMQMVNGYFAAWRAHQNGHLPEDAYQAIARDREVLSGEHLRPYLELALRGREPEFVKAFFRENA